MSIYVCKHVCFTDCASLAVHMSVLTCECQWTSLSVYECTSMFMCRKYEHIDVCEHVDVKMSECVQGWSGVNVSM